MASTACGWNGAALSLDQSSQWNTLVQAQRTLKGLLIVLVLVLVVVLVIDLSLSSGPKRRPDYEDDDEDEDEEGAARGSVVVMLLDASTLT